MSLSHNLYLDKAASLKKLRNYVFKMLAILFDAAWQPGGDAVADAHCTTYFKK